MARVRERYKDEVVSSLMSEFGYKNVYQVPKLSKIVVNIGLGEAVQNGRAIDAATTGFVPDLVLVSSGFDCLAGDPLGGFTLEPNDLGTLTRELVERAEDWCEGRMVVALEGGYAPARVGEGAAAVLRALR